MVIVTDDETGAEAVFAESVPEVDDTDCEDAEEVSSSKSSVTFASIKLVRAVPFKTLC
jgi:hypothetical protein